MAPAYRSRKARLKKSASGMPVEAFIATNDRTALGYFVKPLADFFNRAFRER